MPITARWARSRPVFRRNPDHQIDRNERKNVHLARRCISTATGGLSRRASFVPHAFAALSLIVPDMCGTEIPDSWSFQPLPACPESKIPVFLEHVMTVTGRVVSAALVFFYIRDWSFNRFIGRYLHCYSADCDKFFLLWDYHDLHTINIVCKCIIIKIKRLNRKINKTRGSLKIMAEQHSVLVSIILFCNHLLVLF